MEENLVLTADLANLLDGLDDANLVIAVDHRANKSVRSDSPLEHLQVDETILLDRQVGDLEAVILELPATI